jgi:hypothetical protein
MLIWEPLIALIKTRGPCSTYLFNPWGLRHFS